MIQQARATARFMASTEIWLVAFCVAASVLSQRVLPLALGVATLFWVLRWITYGRPSIGTIGDGAIALLMLMIPVTLWVTGQPDITRTQVYRLLLGVALYYAIANWTMSVARLRLLTMGIMGAGLCLTAIAPFSVIGGVGKLPFIPASIYARATLLVSDTVNSNVMAGALIILLPCSLALLLFAWRELPWMERLLVAAAALSMTGGVILTQSRGALTAFAAVLAGLTALRWRHGWLLILVGSIFAAVAARLVGFGVVWNELSTSGTATNREEIWSRALYVIQDFPFTGIGMGSFQEVTERFYPLFLGPSGQPHAHNLFLQVAVDLGIPGLIAWLSILMLVVVAAWQLYRRGCATHNRLVAGLGAGLLCAQLALVVHGLTDAVTWGMVRTSVLVWALWGVTVASWNIYLVYEDQPLAQQMSGALRLPLVSKDEHYKRAMQAHGPRHRIRDLIHRQPHP